MRSVLILALSILMVGCAVEATENPPSAPAGDSSRVGGTILETLDASSYTYIRFETPGGDAWAAVPRTRLPLGAEVVIANPQMMTGFESKTLGRTFETIYFGTLDDPRAAVPPGAGANPHAGLQGGATPGEPIEIARADTSDGRTIAELYAAKGEIAGHVVTLRGKVVKYNAGIMGRNWIHLQDGTGDTAAGTHDVTVTTTATAAVGQVILAQGSVAVDKDFGAGYRYEIIVEDARVE